MTDSGDNLRQHARVPVRLNVRLSTIDSERDPETGKPCFRSSEETCANLSRGGAFVLTPEPVAPGRRVLVEMCLPSGEEVQAVARVAWSRVLMARSGEEPECGIGVEFLGGAPEQLGALDRYVSHQQRRRSTPRSPHPRTPNPSAGGA